jgi:hypothetical protein
MSEPKRYIIVPGRIYDKEQDDLGLDKVDTVRISIRMNPFCIESYHEAIPSYLAVNENNFVCTKVQMRSGDSYMIYLTISAFEVILDKHVMG